jgi:hypothetical protein
MDANETFSLPLQSAMYFDAPAPSVEIIDLSGPSQGRQLKEAAAMNQETAKQLVAGAKKIARRVDSWIDLSNSLSDPQRGLIFRYFPNMAERREFL